MKAFRDEDIVRYFVMVLRKICDKGYRVTDYDISDMSFDIVSSKDITMKSMIRDMIPESWTYHVEPLLGTNTLTTFKMRDAIGVDDINVYKHRCISSLENYVDNYLLNYC